MKSLFSHSSTISKWKATAVCGIWLVVICGILYFAPRSISPEISASSVNAVQPDSLTLMPGDVLTQQFTVPKGALKNLSLIVTYDDPVQAADTQLLVSVLRNDTAVMEQPLPLSAIPSASFFTFSIEEKEAFPAAYTLRIENLSEASGYSISIPYTTVPNLATSDFSQFCINGAQASGKLLCAIQYVTGYSYYTACCIAFCFFLGGLIFSTLLLRSPSDRQ